MTALATFPISHLLLLLGANKIMFTRNGKPFDLVLRGDTWNGQSALQIILSILVLVGPLLMMIALFALSK